MILNGCYIKVGTIYRIARSKTIKTIILINTYQELGKFPTQNTCKYKIMQTLSV